MVNDHAFAEPDADAAARWRARERLHQVATLTSPTISGNMRAEGTAVRVYRKVTDDSVMLTCATARVRLGKQ